MDIGTPDYSKPDSFLHCSIRGFERYGLMLSEDDYEDMIKQINENRAYFVAKAERKATLWMVYWRELKQVVPVIYLSKRKRINTILARTSIEQRHGGDVYLNTLLNNAKEEAINGLQALRPDCPHPVER